MTISTRWAVGGVAAFAFAWLVLFFEMWWTDGAVVRDNTAWHPYLFFAAALVGLACFAFAWREKRRN